MFQDDEIPIAAVSQRPIAVLYEGDGRQRHLLSMRYDVVSANVSIEPGDLRRGDASPANDDNRREVKFAESMALNGAKVGMIVARVSFGLNRNDGAGSMHMFRSGHVSKPYAETIEAVHRTLWKHARGAIQRFYH